MQCDDLRSGPLLMHLPGIDHILSQTSAVESPHETGFQLYNFANLVYHLVHRRFRRHETIQAAFACVDFDFRNRVTLYTADAKSRSGKVYLNSGYLDGDDHDVSTKDLLSYLWLAHECFFCNLLYGEAPSYDRCEILVTRRVRRHGVEVPDRTMASTVATLRTVDRFLHGLLLPICRRLVLDNMVSTRHCWERAKHELRDFTHPIHKYFMRDFLETDALLRPGWEHADMIREALFESFYFMVRHTEALPLALMPLLEKDSEFLTTWANFKPVLEPYKVWQGTWAYFITDEHLTIRDITNALRMRSHRNFGNPAIELTTADEAALQAATDERVSRAVKRVRDILERDAEIQANRKNHGSRQVDKNKAQPLPTDESQAGQGCRTAEGSGQKKKGKWKKKNRCGWP